MPPQQDRGAARQLIAIVTAGLGLALLAAGSLVHSREAAGAVPDWPLFYGNWWPRYWNGNAGLVNVHRLLAASVTLLAIVLAVWSRRLASGNTTTRFHTAAAVVLFVQVLLGGAIALRLPGRGDVAAHALLAQIAAILLILAAAYGLGRPKTLVRPAEAPDQGSIVGLRAARLSAVLALFQVVLGVFARHPPGGGYVAILAFHVGNAFAMQLALATAATVLARGHVARRWTGLAIGLAALAWVQVMLGLAVLLIAPSPLPEVAGGFQPEVSPRFPLFHAGHVVMAAVLVAGSVGLALGLGRTDEIS